MLHNSNGHTGFSIRKFGGGYRPIADSHHNAMLWQLHLKTIDMRKHITNIYDAPFELKQSPRGEPDWRCLDLSGEHLGARIEELPPGSSSSYHHYHVAEEEHVLVIEGTATLHLGEEAVEIGKGDHVLFRAGEEVAHHIENSSSNSFTYLVFGERKQAETVFYPSSSKVLVRSSQGNRWYTYEEYEPEELYVKS